MRQAGGIISRKVVFVHNSRNKELTTTNITRTITVVLFLIACLRVVAVQRVSSVRQMFYQALLFNNGHALPVTVRLQCAVVVSEC